MERCREAFTNGLGWKVFCLRDKGHQGPHALLPEHQVLDERNPAGSRSSPQNIDARGTHLTHVPDYMKRLPRERGTFIVLIGYADGSDELVRETDCAKPATALRRAITAKEYGPSSVCSATIVDVQHRSTP